MNRRPARLAETPLLAWGEQRRAGRRRRRALFRKGAAAGTGAALLIATIISPPVPRLVWNASASAPIGLYLVTPTDVFRVGAMVIAKAPEPWRSEAARRHYVPATVPLIKRVVAGPGDEVCALARMIYINGRPVAERQARDGMHRAMPTWHGCHRLHGHQYFLLMRGNTRSFDGRYFGPTHDSLLLGEARLLWAP